MERTRYGKNAPWTARLIKPRNEREANAAAYSPSKIFEKESFQKRYVVRAGVALADGIRLTRKILTGEKLSLLGVSFSKEMP